jgi:uncharacterized HAD superfamily protein
MPKDALGVDYDDVVHDFNSPFIVWHNTHYGSEMTYEKAYTFNMPLLYGCTEDEAHHRVHRFTKEHGARSTPIEGAAQALKRLSLHYELHLITSRLETNHDLVMEWLSNHIPGVFTELHFTNGFGGGRHRKRGKSEVCLDIGAVAHIDDSYEHATETTMGAGIPVLMPDRPWNRSAPPHPMIHRMRSWHDITTWLMNNR